MATGRYVVMGVSGAGKTRVASLLAARLGGRFVEGDDLHSPEARARMAAGHPLSDEDRWPWLDRVGAAIAEGDAPVVAACSALRRRYRDRLRAQAPALVTVHLDAHPDAVADRLRARRGHFMPPSLLGSQYATLEPLGADELGVTVGSDRGMGEVLEEVVKALFSLGLPRTV